MGEEICGINKFVERDLDMFLAEELRVSPEFCQWVMSAFEIPFELNFPASNTNVLVVEDGSEADVLAIFQRADGKFHRLYVENKIDASLMPQQLERYLRRGNGDIRRELAASFSVMLFAPSNYGGATPEGVQYITFEAAANALRDISFDLRSYYKASLLENAIPVRSVAGRDAQVAVTDPFIKEWWDTVYRLVGERYPGMFIHRTKYPRSVYFAPSTPDQASYLRVDFKGHKGEVDLAFKGIPVAKLQDVVNRIGYAPGQIVANGKSSALQISGLDPFVISEGLEIIPTKVMVAYRATYDLLSYRKKIKTNSKK